MVNREGQTYCDFEFRGETLYRVTEKQLESIKQLGGGAVSILVMSDFETRPGSSHGQGWAVVAIVRYVSGAEVTVGVMPNGDMHS